MSNSTDKRTASYHWWSRVIAILLALLLALLWWLGYGPGGANRMGCCGYKAPVAAVAPVVAATAVIAGSATVLFANGKITLKGEVGSDAEKQKLLANAAKAYGASNVIDALSVKAGLGPLSQITLAGEVPSDTKKQTDGAAAMTAFSPSMVDNQLTVAKLDNQCVAALKADVAFTIGSSELSLAGKKALDAMAVCLKKGGSIVGHTDNVGQAASNQALSERRAKTSVAYLASKGVSNLSAKGVGDTQPAADNATAQGRAKNRRMEVIAQ